MISVEKHLILQVRVILLLALQVLLHAGRVPQDSTLLG